MVTPVTLAQAQATDRRAPQQALYETIVSWRDELGSQGGPDTSFAGLMVADLTANILQK